MKIKDLRPYFARRPFVPFDIHLTGGHVIPIRDPEAYINCTSTQAYLSHPGRIPEFFSLRHITGIKEAATP